MQHTKTLMACMAATMLFSCTKPENKKIDIKPKSLDSVANEVVLEAWNAFDTTNDLKDVGFYKKREINGIGMWPEDKMLLWASKASYNGPYKIRYIGKARLIDPQKVYKDDGPLGGEFFTFYLNDSLKGQPIFEVYNDSTKQVYKRIVASPDSCGVTIYLGWVTNPIKVDTGRVRNNYHYFLSKIEALNYEITEDE
ncbi:hypothetical protein [Rurimicrobium arvi]|uniref:Uncharacterized protein n=1 Tax=Rurimicrobium arvi TaxID=2049916 RepID=A0ABP8MXU0_9BACT